MDDSAGKNPADKGVSKRTISQLARAELSGRTATFHLGYSHPVEFPLPDGIDAQIDKTKITLSGIDKELLGKTAAKIRGFRKPEPYKGKGIRYENEIVRRKAGKTGAK